MLSLDDKNQGHGWIFLNIDYVHVFLPRKYSKYWYFTMIHLASASVPFLNDVLSMTLWRAKNFVKRLQKRERPLIFIWFKIFVDHDYHNVIYQANIFLSQLYESFFVGAHINDFIKRFIRRQFCCCWYFSDVVWLKNIFLNAANLLIITSWRLKNCSIYGARDYI